MIPGFATSTGTKTFSEKFLIGNYNFFQNLHLSNVGIGTYLGEPDSQTDTIVKDAVKKSILSGVNVIDTAINHRAQKSERSIGAALSELINENLIKRDEVFICTKNGYVTNDGMWAAIPFGKKFMIIHNGCQVKVLSTYKQSVDFINNQRKTIKKKSRK